MSLTGAIRILVVDDSEEQRGKLRKMIGRPDIEIVETASGPEAIQAAASGRFSTILLDVRMPGMDGFQVAQRLRSMGASLYAPIIFLTGAPAPDSMLKRGYALGAVDFLSYPLVPEIFRAKLDVFIELSQKTLALDRYAADLEEQVHRRTAELEYQSRLARTLTDNAVSALFLIDAERRVTFMNPAAERLTDKSFDEIRGTYLDELPKRVHMGERVGSTISEAIRSMTPVRNLEDSFSRPDGTFFPALCTLTLLGPKSGEWGAVVEIMDITEAKRAEQTSRHNEERLRKAQKLESVAKLSAGIAHDFNNLLTTINGYSLLALGTLPPGEPYHDHFQEILQAGRRAADLTAQLLAFGRQQMLVPTVLNLNTCIEECHQMISGILGEDIRLILSLAPDLGTVSADVGQIRKLLLNLILNAKDAMPQGGLLSITTQNTEGRATMAPVSKEAGEYVLLSVSDTGIGMDAEVKARIFDPFFTTKAFGRSSGMGLATVDGIVNQSGGLITVDSAPGVGSTFFIHFPRAHTDTPEIELKPI